VLAIDTLGSAGVTVQAYEAAFVAAAVEVGVGGGADDWPPGAVGGSEALLVGGEFFEVAIGRRRLGGREISRVLAKLQASQQSPGT